MTVAGLAGFVWTSQSSALPACPTVLGNFEIDGDMTQATCTPALDDWNTPGLGVQQTSQGGTYSTSGKDHQDPSGWSSTGSTPDKTNFEHVYAFSRVVNGKFFTYVAWERTDTSGTQGYAIEIDNAPPRTANDANHTPQPDRSNGGVVVYISSVGSGAPQFSSACTFTSQATYGSTCTTSNGDISAAINTASISDPFRGTTQDPGSFFEVAIDVTDLTGIVPSCPGDTAASAYIRSVTGQVDNGNLKGYMNPLTLQPDSTCVAPPIQTTATPGGDLNPPGATQHDAVTVGTAQAPGVGTVKFFLCSPTEVTTNQGDCSANGTQVGSAVTLDGNGQGTSADVTGLTTPNDNALGKYCWRAEFTPGANDHNYLPGTHTNTDTECFTVLHGTPSIATTIAVTGTNAPGLGFTTLGDSAQLSGWVNSVTNETITFNLYGPYSGSIPSTCTNDTPVFTTTGQMNASGLATTSATFKPTEAGKYVWVASYPGDTLNDPIAGTCSDANENTEIIAAQVDVSKSANPKGPVSAGETIGFDITVSNAGNVPATGVHVTDTLPTGADGVAGGDLNWSLDPSYTGCSISAGVLTCDFTQVDGQSSLPAIHISSPTTQADCGVVKNKASVTTTNGTGGDSDVATVTVQCAALSIAKSADDASVSAGSQIGFTVTASNTGAGSASGVLVSDPLPGGTGVTWSIDAGNTSGPLSCSITGSAPSQSLGCTGTLAAGASETVHVVSGTTSASCKTYDNTAQVSATNVTGSPSSSAHTTVLCPGLDITKVADDATVSAGDNIGFTMSVTNNGAGTATAATMHDALPAGSGVDWVISPAYSGPGTCAITGPVGTQVLDCSFGALAPTASASVHISSGTTFASCKTYDNTATAHASNQANDPSASDHTAVQCPDVTITKTADDAVVDAGSQIGFVVTVTNSDATGTGQAHGVVVDDPLPGGTGIDWSITGPAGNCTIQGSAPTQTLHCAYDALGAGSGFSVHVVSGTAFASCGVYPNDAELTALNFPTAHAKASTTVQCPTLSITKTADDDTVSAGDQIGFTINFANGGPGMATGATISDVLPSGTGVSWSISPAYAGPGTCDITGSGPQVLNCALGDLASGANGTVHIVSGTEFQSCGTYENTATVDATNAPALDSEQVSTEVQCPNPNLTKTADADTVSAGEAIGFTITASNGDDPGTGIARDIVINDPLPSGNGISWSMDQGPDNCSITTDPSTSDQTLHCTAVDLGPGETETVHVTSETAFVSCAVYDNTATMTLTNGPVVLPTAVVAAAAAHADATSVGDPVVFFATASVTVSCPALAVTKVADADAVDAGQPIGFTIHATNAGPGTAFAAVIQDPLPAHPGAHWTVSPAYAGPGTCTIAGPDGTQVLTCALGDFPAGGDATVHVTASTTADSCGAYNNTVSLLSGNAPTVSASAGETVNCAGVSPETPPPPPLATTGAGPINGEFGWAFALILLGLVLTFAGRKRRVGPQH